MAAALTALVVGLGFFCACNPGAVPEDPYNRALRDTVADCECPETYPSNRARFSYCLDLLHPKLGGGVTFPLEVGSACSAFLLHVPVVVTLGPEEEMFRVYAPRIITSVENAHLGGDLPDKEGVGGAVGVDGSTAASGAKRSISSGIDRSVPKPATLSGRYSLKKRRNSYVVHEDRVAGWEDNAFQMSGRLSVYRPGDGWNRGELACGGIYRETQLHIAHRNWRRLGCGRRVMVCAEDTGRCVLTRVMDAGPWGIYRGPLRNAVPDGRWKIWTRSLRPPKGWRFRAVTDLSWALWKRLGRPRGLSRVHLTFLPRGAAPAPTLISDRR